MSFWGLIPKSIKKAINKKDGLQDLFYFVWWDDAIQEAIKGKPGSSLVVNCKTKALTTAPLVAMPNRSLADVATIIGPQCLDLLAHPSLASLPSMVFYRGASPTTAKSYLEKFKLISTALELQGYQADKDTICPFGGHFGDLRQATYYAKVNENPLALRFTLKPGAHVLLFSNLCMALAPKGKKVNSRLACLGLLDHLAGNSRKQTRTKRRRPVSLA